MTVDLTTRYLGLELASPLVASASPLTGKVDTLIQLEQAGAAAVVLPSLFEEQINHDEKQLAMLYDHQADSFAESLSYFPEIGPTGGTPDDYLKLIEKAKARDKTL